MISFGHVAEQEHTFRKASDLKCLVAKKLPFHSEDKDGPLRADCYLCSSSGATSGVVYVWMYRASNVSSIPLGHPGPYMVADAGDDVVPPEKCEGPPTASGPTES